MTSSEIREQIEVLNARRSRLQSDRDQTDAVVAHSRFEIVSIGNRSAFDKATIARSRRDVLDDAIEGCDQEIKTLRAELPAVEAEERQTTDFAELARIAKEATAHLEELERSRKALNDALTKHAALLVKHRNALVQKRGEFIDIASRYAPLQYSAIRMPTADQENALNGLVVRLEEEMGVDLSAVLFPWGSGRTEIDRRQLELAELEFADVIGSLVQRGPH